MKIYPYPPPIHFGKKKRTRRKADGLIPGTKTHGARGLEKIRNTSLAFATFFAASTLGLDAIPDIVDLAAHNIWTKVLVCSFGGFSAIFGGLGLSAHKSAIKEGKEAAVERWEEGIKDKLDKNIET